MFIPGACHRLYVPVLRKEAWFPYLEENDIFQNFTGNIMLCKHYRYSPVYVHEHEFFEILNYLNHNYQTATLSDTAAHFGYSVSHFSTLIKEGTGQTFLQIIRSIKLNQACRPLRETTLSIPAIRELVGYETPEHFMRTFKKAYGMTPGEYRKQPS